MSLDLSTPTDATPPGRRRSRGIWLVPTALLVVGVLWAWGSKAQMSSLWSRTPPPLDTLEVDQGEIALVVTENGTLESASSATARCRVESILGLVGGAQNTNGANSKNGTQGKNQGGMSGQQGQSGQGQSGQQQGSSWIQQQQELAKQNQSKTKSKSKNKTASKSKSGSSSSTSQAKGAAGSTEKESDGPTQAKSKSGGSGGMGGSGSGGGSGGSGGGGGMGGSGGGGGSGWGGGGGSGQNGGSEVQTTILAPEIRSFTYQVIPHQPLKPQTKNSTQQTKTQQQQQAEAANAGGGGGRGGGGRGGRGGSSGPGNENEKAGSTRITYILPEGSWVKAGDVVCELDAAAFQDELQAQRIRYAEAKAYVEQAKGLLMVSEITLREYRDGIYPQDVQLIRQYLQLCRTEAERTERNYAWSKATAEKHFRAPAQVKADELAMERARLALREAEGMQERLDKYTGPRLKKNLEAKIAAIRADKFALEQSFELESDRLKKLEAMVEYCTMRAPGDGLVVYASQPNRFGQVSDPIQEGVTVRQGQPIFYLPDPEHMQVKAKVNESKVALLQSGQPALVTIDAYPDRPLRGTVAEITPIPAPANGPTSDVRVYHVVIKIESKTFAELRPGLNAEVDFLIDAKPRVTRVPLQAIRWLNNMTYVAVALDSKAKPGSRAGQAGTDAPSWRWQPVTLGMSNPTYIEVISGLEPGQKVLAHPEALPVPRIIASPPNVAANAPQPRG